MDVRQIHHILQTWAPAQLAWEKDNVGLLVGSWDRRVRSIVVALDLTPAVLKDAQKASADLIITHHPLIFTALKQITDDTRVGRLVRELIERDIALYATHTNLDFAPGGVSEALAKRLGLKETSVLASQKNLIQKVTVYVPAESLDRVMGAMSEAGAGRLGKYSECSFQVTGTGTFTPLEGANPAVGRIGHRASVNETRLEMMVPSWKMKDVVRAMKSAHPYEEVAYDAYPLLNTTDMFGAGIIGKLPRPRSTKDFLKDVCDALKVSALRYSPGSGSKISTVAVCGGSGSEYLKDAIVAGADAYVTADVRYHTFQEAEGQITIIDAGHFETEAPAVETIVDFLETNIPDPSVKVRASGRMHNPVHNYIA